MSFSSDQWLKCKYGNRSFSSLFEADLETIEIIPDLRQVFKEEKNYYATGVLDFEERQLYEVTTEAGYRIVCTKDQEFPVLRDQGRDIYRRNIKTFVDIPLGELDVGEALMIYQKTTKKSSYGFETRKNIVKNTSATMMTMIQTRPDRFLSSNDLNPMSDDNLNLVLDTIKETNYFNVHDLNTLRKFSTAMTRFVNELSMEKMKHLHWFGYKSHLGEIIYDLAWLDKYFQSDCGFDIYDIYNKSNFKYLQGCSLITFKSILNFIIKSCFFVMGIGKKSLYNFYHREEALLREIQLKLLDVGVMSSIMKMSPRVVDKAWKKTGVKSYWRFLIRKAGGKPGNLRTSKDLKVLQINPAHLDKFIDLVTSLNDESSYTRKARVIRAYHRGKNLTKRDSYWDKIETIKKIGTGTVYNVVHSNGKHIVVNGIVCKDWS